MIISKDHRQTSVSGLVSGAHYRGEEVVGAGDEEALGHVVAPAEEGSARDEDGVGPGHQQDPECHARGDLLTGETLHRH